MTNIHSGMPGVTVDEGRVSDFLMGIRGSNLESNAKARKKAVVIGAGLIAYGAIASKKKRRK